MKCIRKADEVQRVDDNKAAEMVNQGWAYCGKELWKASIRPAKASSKPEAGKKPADKGEKLKKKGKESKTSA